VLHSSERFFDKEAFLEVGLNVSLTLLLIMDLSSQFGTVPVQFPCKTMMRTPQSLGLLPRFMFHGSKIEVYSHEKEALLSRYSSVQITVQPVEKLPAELPGKQMSLTALRESENGKETKMGNKEE
jgi:hypothetical protein